MVRFCDVTPDPAHVCSPWPQDHIQLEHILTRLDSTLHTMDVPLCKGDVIYLHEPLLWTLRQHATNGVSGPDSLARAIGAVAPPLLEITARVGELQ